MVRTVGLLSNILNEYFNYFKKYIILAFQDANVAMKRFQSRQKRTSFYYNHSTIYSTI